MHTPSGLTTPFWNSPDGTAPQNRKDVSSSVAAENVGLPRRPSLGASHVNQRTDGLPCVACTKMYLLVVENMTDVASGGSTGSFRTTGSSSSGCPPNDPSCKRLQGLQEAGRVKGQTSVRFLNGQQVTRQISKGWKVDFHWPRRDKGSDCLPSLDGMQLP